MAKAPPVEHVPGHGGEHACERGHRNERRQRRREQHENEQEDRVQHARYRPMRTGADIGRGARDRAGDANAAEQSRADIGRALGHQFTIGAVPPSGHAVGDHRREQRFDRAQQREGDRAGQHTRARAGD